MKLKPPTKENLELVRQWRNECMETLRTPYMLTEQQQEDFYDSLCSRTSPHRYYELWSDGRFVGLGGITYIQWENRCGEISLILAPDARGCGLGRRAVSELYRTAFNELNLNMVFGEVYDCNKAVPFWEKQCRRYNGYITDMPDRKYWNGNYHWSRYFSVTKEKYEKSIQQAGD
jgi:RimJ/RimL family protein N-acetyltransferase